MNQVSYDTKRNKEYLGGKKKKMIKQKIVFVLVVAIVFLAMAGGAEANSRSDTLMAVQEDTSGPAIVSYAISNHTIT
ncbi:hypothetical protein C5S35_07505, partial [Candidatus Methanophagaceae archaeon]